MSILGALTVAKAAKGAGGFIAKHWQVIGLSLCLVAFLAVFYAFAQGRERAEWKPKLEAVQSELKLLKENYRAASEEQERKLADQTRRAEVLAQQVAHVQERNQAHQSAADAIRRELRDARSAGATRALTAAYLAPAACRDYEADRTRLPARDQDFLVDFARRCNLAAEQANACADYAVGLHAICFEAARGAPSARTGPSAASTSCARSARAAHG